MIDRSIDSQLGEILGQNKMILRELDQATQSRADQGHEMVQIRKLLVSLDNRTTAVEESLIVYRPTIDEFLDIKKKVIGAGQLGKWLWAIGAAILSFLFIIRTELYAWLVK